MSRPTWSECARATRTSAGSCRLARARCGCATSRRRTEQGGARVRPRRARPRRRASRIAHRGPEAAARGGRGSRRRSVVPAPAAAADLGAPALFATPATVVTPFGLAWIARSTTRFHLDGARLLIQFVAEGGERGPAAREL